MRGQGGQLSARSRFVAAIALAAGLAVPALASAQAPWPARPIRILLPAPPGGTTDFLARIFAQRMDLGQPVIIEAKPGASGNLAVDLVAKAPPDGYTLVVGAPGALAINPSLFRKMPFDPQKDLTPIVLAARVPLLVAVHPSLPAANIAQLVALAKANPDRYTYGTPGPGTPQHLATEMFASMAGGKLRHIPYKGSGQSVADLLGGQIDLAFEATVSLLPHVRGGKLRALAVTSAERIASMSDIATVAETLPGFEATAWYGIVGPAGLPPEIVTRLNGAMRKALDHPESRAQLATIGSEPVHGSAESFRELMQSERAKWAKVIRDAGVAPVE